MGVRTAARPAPSQLPEKIGNLLQESRWLALGAAWQLGTGLSNVVLDWPLLAAVAHTGGAAGLVVVYALVLLAQWLMHSTWVLYTSFRFDWTPRDNGIALPAPAEK